MTWIFVGWMLSRLFVVGIDPVSTNPDAALVDDGAGGQPPQGLDGSSGQPPQRLDGAGGQPPSRL